KLSLLECIAFDLKIIHSHKLIHRDLHSGNILLATFQSAYIADLGLSTMVNTKSNNKVYGILPYIAPEVLYNGIYKMESDVYSFGIIAYEIVSSLQAYNNIPHDIYLQRMIYNGLRPRIPKHTPQLVTELIIKCWSAQPDQRPTSVEIYDIINTWNNDILNNRSTEIVTQIEEANKMRVSNMPTSSHINSSYPEEIYVSMQFDHLNTTGTGNVKLLESFNTIILIKYIFLLIKRKSQ
ncbi:kinase-like domain-containing protein, partial [Gigaspora rosea]